MSSPSTVHRLHYGATLQLANAAARVGEAVGLPLGRLEADSILDAARRQTGLTDWGDEHFLEPLNHVVAAVREREAFTPLARIILRQSWIRAVCNRLWVQDWVKQHPETLQTSVQRPIFVLGFPRTGTTVLQNLFALKEGRRGLYFWELTNPVPTTLDRDEDRARRRKAAQTMLRAAYLAAPEMAEVHYVDVDTVEECWPLFANSFCVMNWELQSGLEAYGKWLLDTIDMRIPYGEYKRHLQVLVAQNPADQLVLKCPEHLWFVDALLATFPDACIVWTHRDPFDTLASYCSLMSLQWRTLYGHIDRPAIGAYMQRSLHTGVQRAMAARERHDPRRFYDVRFEELVADPAGVLEKASAWFDLELPPDHRQQVTAYLGQKRSDERGRHRYSADDYGLDPDRVRELYGDYIRQFGVETGKNTRTPAPAGRGG
ncbi:MAG: sulfotransferase [Alphaproteobacteria bacterium]|nr:sulfotransferase [Alphaproteobacteria bacterium]